MATVLIDGLAAIRRWPINLWLIATKQNDQMTWNNGEEIVAISWEFENCRWMITAYFAIGDFFISFNKMQNSFICVLFLWLTVKPMPIAIRSKVFECLFHYNLRSNDFVFGALIHFNTFDELHINPQQLSTAAFATFRFLVNSTNRSSALCSNDLIESSDMCMDSSELDKNYIPVLHIKYLWYALGNANKMCYIDGIKCCCIAYSR